MSVPCLENWTARQQVRDECWVVMRKSKDLRCYQPKEQWDRCEGARLAWHPLRGRPQWALGACSRVLGNCSRFTPDLEIWRCRPCSPTSRATSLPSMMRTPTDGQWMVLAYLLYWLWLCWRALRPSSNVTKQRRFLASHEAVLLGQIALYNLRGLEEVYVCGFSLLSISLNQGSTITIIFYDPVPPKSWQRLSIFDRAPFLREPVGKKRPINAD